MNFYGLVVVHDVDVFVRNDVTVRVRGDLGGDVVEFFFLFSFP